MPVINFSKMPTYEYHCDACHEDLEVFQSMKDDPLSTCPECGKRGKIHRRISGGAGIIFKGSGFYETDYKTKSGKSDNNAGDKAEKPAETKAEKPQKQDKAAPATADA